MDDWTRLNETSLLGKETFYSRLNMEDIADADYKHAKRLCKDFEIKHLGEHHDFLVQSDTLLLADKLNSFWKLEIYRLDPTHFFLHQD